MAERTHRAGHNPPNMIINMGRLWDYGTPTHKRACVLLVLTANARRDAEWVCD